jgi:hypothetical protein
LTPYLFSRATVSPVDGIRSCGKAQCVARVQGQKRLRRVKQHLLLLRRERGKAAAVKRQVAGTPRASGPAAAVTVSASADVCAPEMRRWLQNTQAWGQPAWGTKTGITSLFAVILSP